MSEFSQVSQKYAQPEVVKYWHHFNQRGLQAAEAYFIHRYFEPACKILDLGCGAGRVAAALGSTYAVYGTDLTFELMQTGNDYLAQNLSATAVPTRFWQANLLALPLPDHSFDCAVCLYATIQHIPGKENRLKAFAEMARVMKPGGNLIVGIDNLAPALSCYGWWIKRKLLREERVALAQLEEEMEEDTAVSPSQNSSPIAHLSGIGRSLRWRTLQPLVNIVHHLLPQSGESGDRMIDRVSQQDTPGRIRFHIYQHQSLLAEASQSSFSLVEYLSNREAQENQLFPEAIRQREHQIVYVFRLN